MDAKTTAAAEKAMRALPPLTLKKLTEILGVFADARNPSDALPVLYGLTEQEITDILTAFSAAMNAQR